MVCVLVCTFVLIRVVVLVGGCVDITDVVGGGGGTCRW